MHSTGRSSTSLGITRNLGIIKRLLAQLDHVDTQLLRQSRVEAGKVLFDFLVLFLNTLNELEQYRVLVVEVLHNKADFFFTFTGNYSGLLLTCQRRGNRLKYTHDEEEELQALREENRTLKALVAELLPLKEQLAQATARIKELEDRLTKDSRTSSKPPSSDGLGVCPAVLVVPAASVRKVRWGMLDTPS